MIFAARIAPGTERRRGAGRLETKREMPGSHSFIIDIGDLVTITTTALGANSAREVKGLGATVVAHGHCRRYCRQYCRRFCRRTCRTTCRIYR